MRNTIGAVIMDLEGVELTPEEQELLAHPLIGGVILFTRNYEARAQLKSLCNNIRAARKHPLLIMVDQEGGRVQRFIPEFTRLPHMGIFGQIFDNDPASACLQAENCGWIMATELLSTGVDLSLAPVLDLNKKVSNVIGERAFHEDPQVVTRLATAFIHGMQQAGMSAVGKHFPGHGSVSADSHAAIPIDDRALNAIEQEDLQTFVNLIKTNIPAIMAAHVIFPKVDEFQVGFSRFWLKNILRTKLGFTGCVFSDDLNMEGANISTNFVDRVNTAREAGCDFTLLCNNRQAIINVIDALPEHDHQVSPATWIPLQGKFSFVQEPLSKSQRWQTTRDYLQSKANQHV